MLSRLKDIAAVHLPGGKGNRDLKQILKQCAVIFIALGFILLLYEFLGGIIAASLGASSCILFLTPNKTGSRSVNLIGGYLLAAVSGIIFCYLHIAVLNAMGYAEVDIVLVIARASAAALTTFLMAWTRLIHPPSAALALGLTADINCLRTAAAAIIGIVILCLIRYCLRKHLKNLI